MSSSQQRIAPYLGSPGSFFPHHTQVHLPFTFSIGNRYAQPMQGVAIKLANAVFLKARNAFCSFQKKCVFQLEKAFLDFRKTAFASFLATPRIGWAYLSAAAEKCKGVGAPGLPGLLAPLLSHLMTTTGKAAIEVIEQHWHLT